MIFFKEHITSDQTILLYTGDVNVDMLDNLAQGPGDIWHSSLCQGYINAFEDIVYFTASFWWYVNDFKGIDTGVSWRINPNAFVVRKSVWEKLRGFDPNYGSIFMQALDFGYNALKNCGAIPLFCRGLYDNECRDEIDISVQDRYIFYRKNFKPIHGLFMLYRNGFNKRKEWKGFLFARKHFHMRVKGDEIPPRTLKPIKVGSTVSYIIPTMLRQDYTLQLLEDLGRQTYLPNQVVVIDATPPNDRKEFLYDSGKYPFEVQFHWQTTQGSCRARNEAIAHCTSDYIVFGDDDIRIPPDFIEGHIRLLQTYNAVACNGLDIRADHPRQGLKELEEKLIAQSNIYKRVGAAQQFSNANSCVKREWVNQLIGNDINFDGGYGEDNDFGLSLTKKGVVVLNNPFSANLHLKPPSGGYRFWGEQAGIIGAKRIKQPWELDNPVKWVRPVPSPTIMYGILKHFTPKQLIEYKHKYFFLYLFKKSIITLPLRLLKLPYKLLQFRRSVFYAKKLMQLGVRHK